MLVITNEQGFLNMTKKVEHIVCFGMSFQLIEKINRYWKDISSKISHVIDNSKDKQGTKMILAQKEFVVESVEEVSNKDCGNSLIIIGNRNYHAVLDQIEEYDTLKEIPAICYALFSAKVADELETKKKIPDNLHLTSEQRIPKTIHYCWFGGQEMPDNYKRWMESWYKYCPDYEIIRWDESNYDINKIPYMAEAYERRKWGFVSDYARIDVVYQHGGIYLDTDVELVKNLDDLLYQNAFMGFETGGKIATGLGFGAVKGHPILKETLDGYLGRHFIRGDGSEDQTACPVYQTEILLKHGLVSNKEYQIVSDITIYPEKMLCGKNMYTMQTSLTDYTHAIHHFDGSWSEAIWKKRNDRLRNAATSI